MLAALTGLLLIVFNSGFAAPWETFTIFALMFTGTMLYRAEAGQYPWRRALYVTVLVFGLTLVARAMARGRGTRTSCRRSCSWSRCSFWSCWRAAG